MRSKILHRKSYAVVCDLVQSLPEEVPTVAWIAGADGFVVVLSSSSSC